MWSILLNAALAGEPGSLCEAVAQADVIVEVGFQSQGEYPSAWKRKRWEPPDEAVLPTVATARVQRVLKGEAQGWVPELDDLGFSNQAATWWDRFFAEGEFQAILMLSGTTPALEASGWLADSGDCHVSWCWEAHRSAILACLDAQGVRPPTPTETAGPPPPAQAPPPVEAPPPPPAEAASDKPGGWFRGCAGG